MPSGEDWLIGDHPVCSDRPANLVSAVNPGRWIHDKLEFWLAHPGTAVLWGLSEQLPYSSGCPASPHLHVGNNHCKAGLWPCVPQKGTPNSARWEGRSQRQCHKGGDSSPSCPHPQPLLPLNSTLSCFKRPHLALWKKLFKTQQSPTLLKLFLTSSSIKTPPVGSYWLPLVNMKHFNTPLYLHTQHFHWPPSFSETGIMSPPTTSTMEVTNSLDTGLVGRSVIVYSLLVMAGSVWHLHFID